MMIEMTVFFCRFVNSRKKAFEMRAARLRGRRTMAPNSSAVEIDPRLLRQLEEEYEALKNDSSGASRFRDETRPSSRPRPTPESPPFARLTH